jgi:DNA-directed RNA polymerase specialized sigma24 family protein
MAEDEEEDDDLASPMPELDDLAVEGDDPVAPELDPAILRRFLSSQKALDVAAAAIKPIVPAQQVGDLAAEAVIRALNARKPRAEVVIPAWLAEIARRVAARYLEKKKRRAKYEGPMPVRRAREDDYTGHKVEHHAVAMGNYFDPDGPEDEEEMLDPFMDGIVLPHDRAILEVLREQGRTKKTYAALAAERGESEDQLWRKIHRFKVKYRPRVRRRRSVMLWIKRAAIGTGTTIGLAALGVLLYLLLHRRAEDMLPDPASLPLPSATASVQAPLIAADTLRDARDLRETAFAECRATRWDECLRRLDAAKALDPAGDTAPEVKAAREQAAREQTDQTPGEKKPKQP